MDFSIKIGNIIVDPATAIAPMEGITDAPFRKLIRSLGGCGLSVTEFVSCEALTRDVEKAWEHTVCDQSENPSSVQIYGRIPENLARAAAMCEERGAHIVDLNLGCPAKSVVSGNAGSALMKEPELCREIFRQVRAAISIPMTVKMRLGWSEHKMTAPIIAKMAEDEGAAMVAIHGRTREEAYRGKSRWHLIKPITEALSIPVLVNGDILTREDARRALDESGAAGIMVGRGLLRNPWLLRQIAEEREGKEIFSPTLDQRLQFVLKYIDLLEQTDLRESAILGKIKCFMGYFARALAYASRTREMVYKTHSIPEIRELITDYFEKLQSDNLADIFDQYAASEADQRFREGDSRTVQLPDKNATAPIP